MVVGRTVRSSVAARWRRPRLSATYELDQREVDVDDGLCAYLTEQSAPPDADRPRPSRAVLLLPGARGWRCSHTRKLADRLAVFCCALVLVPDVHRGGAPWPR